MYLLPLLVTGVTALGVALMIVLAYRMGVDGVAENVTRAERGIIDLLSAFVPYAVPVIPAYLTFYHTRDIMNFPPWVALVSAFVVETLGLASVSTAVRFWRNNLIYTSEKNRAPFWTAAGIYTFYIVVVLTVNVVLEIVAGTRTGWIIFAIGLFSLLSFPSGVLIAIRTQFAEVLDTRKARVQPAKPVEDSKPAEVERKRKYASDYREKIVDLIGKYYAKNGVLPTPKQITAQIKGLEHDNAKGYVSTTIDAWARENNIEKKKPLGF